LARQADTAAEFEENVELQQRLGVPSELLEPEAALEYCPGLEHKSFRRATYCPTDGWADPHLALQAYAKAARNAGAEIRTNTAVTDISRDGDVVSGVRTQADRTNVDFVVNAGGAWANAVSGLANVKLPIAPRRRQITIANPETPVPGSVPLVIDLDTGSYFRPERDGAALVGGHFTDVDPNVDPDAYSKQSDLDWTATALDRAADYTTYFGPASEIKRGWAGLYAVTPDHHPIIEETVPGLITASGFSGHGFQHGPATGRIVADLIECGETKRLDVSSLTSDRFKDGSGIEERNVA
jgi:sarcosine oxidase subunit beta